MDLSLCHIVNTQLVQYELTDGRIVQVHVSRAGMVINYMLYQTGLSNPYETK